jgi:hypothetical protein
VAQAGDNELLFWPRHASILFTTGISAPQNLKASPIQADRCSDVPWANAVADSKISVAKATHAATVDSIRKTFMTMISCLSDSFVATL